MDMMLWNRVISVSVEFVDLSGALGVELLDVLDTGLHLSQERNTPIMRVLSSD